MDNMKARAWRDSRMPVLPMPPALREEMEVYTARLVEGAEQASFYMVQGLREAFSNRPSDLSLDAAFLSQARARFMAQTQASFFGCLGRLGQVVREGAGAEVVREVVDAWRKELSVVAEQLWDDLSQSGYFQAVDPARMARAYHALRGRLRSPKFYEALGLPVPESKKKTKKKKKAS
jgi:hypothetical protein